MSEKTSAVNEPSRLVEVYRLTNDISCDSDPVLNSIVTMIAVHYGVSTAMVSIVDKNYKIVKARVGIDLERVPRERAFSSYGVGNYNVMEMADVSQDPRFADNPLVKATPFIKYYASAPLITARGIILGRLCVLDNKVRSPMSASDKSFLVQGASIVVARLEAIYKQRFIDPLTGLPNRQSFERDIRRKMAGQEGSVALLVEPLSATAIDRLIKALGLDFFAEFILCTKKRLLELLAPDIQLYKVSKLSFVVLLEVDSGRRLPGLLSSIKKAFDQPLISKNLPIYSDVGIGVLQLPPGERMNVDHLRLMSSITGSARTCERRWLYYDAAVDSRTQRSANLLNSIETALLASDQLRLVYQPRIRLDDNECVSAEALLRWTHPVLGEISPAEFIGLAETTASIRNITHWVVRNVCRQLAEWRCRGRVMTVSLNISALDLTDERLLTVLTDALDTFGVEPEQIELEFTENVLVNDFSVVRPQLLRLRSMGIAIGIDDFGSGYSNWSYLREIPATCVKLDRSLLSNLFIESTDRHIVKGLIRLSRDLNLKVVAEGVETEQQHALLCRWGCDEAQGYYFSRPLPPDEFIELSSWFSK